METPRILIIGGGFAGVCAAAGAVATGGESVAVELISPDPCLVIKPRLYEWDLSGVGVPLDRILGPIGVRHHRGTVGAIDTDARTVTLDGGASLGYEQLILAAGSSVPIPAGAHGVDTFEQATALGVAIRRGARSVAVVGGGFTGLEIAAELAGHLERVTLVESGAHAGSGYGPRAVAEIEDALDRLGVEVRTGTRVSDPRELDADLVVWTTGPRASGLTAQVPGECDGSGRLVLDANLAAAPPGVWVAGDCGAARADADNVAVMSCQHAMPQGRRAGENAAAVALGRAPLPYAQPMYNTCLALGAAGALLTTGFARDRVVASGAEVAAFKGFINRSLIYPSPEGDRAAILRYGTPAPPGPRVSAVMSLALRSARLRAAVASHSPDLAAGWALREPERVGA